MNWLKRLYLYVMSKLRKPSPLDDYTERQIKEDLAFVLDHMNSIDTPFYEKNPDPVDFSKWKTNALKTKDDQQ